MALTAAERARKYRAKRDADPQQRERWLSYQKDKYRKDKLQGKRKMVKDMSRREHRLAKRDWKQRQRKSRESQHLQNHKETESVSSSFSSPGTSSEASFSGMSRQRLAAIKRRDLEKRELEKKVADLERQLQFEKKKAWMYQKRLDRQARQTKDHKDTPRKKAKHVLKYGSKKTLRKKTLVFHFAMVDQIKNKYKAGEHKIRDVFLANSVLRKYRFKASACRTLGLFPRTLRQKKGCLSVKVRVCVRKFFERDDVSRMLSGKRSTVTRKKVTKQKRVLCDTLRNLHIKYQAETLENVSFTTFWRLKPFWVTYPTASERETCLCKTCENVKLMAESLKAYGVTETAKIDVLVGEVVCSKEDKQCMYRLCEKCKHRHVSGVVTDLTREVSWSQWKTVREERTLKNGENKMVTYTKREPQEGTIGALWDKFHEHLHLLCHHAYNIVNQYKHMKYLKETMPQTECIVHVDFSGNFVAKMHFGASQVQMTLHTGCYYLSGQEKPVLFSGVSDSLQHDPTAVWAFLRPVLADIKSTHPKVEKVHFFSDGPTTQYRQKQNFYLLSTEMDKLGFSGATWNFFAAGHGKGIPDSVGGILKRTADRKVLQGSDIKNSADFVKLLEPSTSIKLYRIKDSDIMDVEEPLLTKTLKTVPGTMKLHQIIVMSPEHIKCREVSCACVTEMKCIHDHRQDREVSLVPWGSEGCKRQRKGDVRNKTEVSPQMPKNESKGAGEFSVPANETSREQHFRDHLNVLQTASSFAELQGMCRNFDLGNDVTGVPRYIEKDNLSVDYQSLKLYPSDIAVPDTYPVSVRADGNCLPACGSVFAFGHDGRPAEMRARIVHELALYPEYYLGEDNMRKGVHENRSVLNSFAMYSDEYTPGTRLSTDVIRTTYEKETLKITKMGVFMGIWQACALASVLQSRIFFAYPNLGNPFVRKDLHRLILPRVNPVCAETLIIMWTSTRGDMVDEHWCPNHFVPGISQSPRTEETQFSSAPTLAPEVPPPEECLGRWVVIKYDGKLYPGVVEDVDGGNVLYIDCMHRVGKASNTFFWPRIFRDINWYDHEDIMSLITPPTMKPGTSNHFVLDPAVWNALRS